MNTIDVLHRAADLTIDLGPDPEGAIRAAVYGRPDITLPHWDTTESLLVEDACMWLQRHINPDVNDVDYFDTIGEWAAGRSTADVRAALFDTACALEGVTL